ncbi:hypothetical protein DLAC_09260 [Tieghemostelium lacteum]|uniref:Uncharacterized protein n=1 Tax=Tieghemostelium lacteum TaxID=361077 RepID=A0A151Z9J9_TIELA|nr:hypothetical protein DLAC_09260 [Tieghemostelium lacteum]|eukprot:KYQ90631.1 hypothetical protein DLAC_09260 [Tieghemostelium lacteum]
MYRKVLLLAFIATIFIFTSEARTVTLDGVKACGATLGATCKLDSMMKLLGGTLSKADDVIIKGAKNMVYTVTSPIVCHSMNVTQGVLALNAKADVSGNIYIANDASIIINADLLSNANLNVDGSVIVKAGSSLVNKLNCNSCALNLQGGSLAVNGLVADASSTCSVVGGTIKHAGECVYNTIPKCSGSGIFAVDANANVVLNSGITCLDKSVLNLGSKATVDIKADSNIVNAINLNTDAVVKVSNNADCVFSGIKGATGSVLAVADANVHLNAPSTCHYVTLDGLSNVKLTSDCAVTDLKASATSTIDLSKTAKLDIKKIANCDSKLNLNDQAVVLVNANANANINGGIKCLGQSTVKVLDNCNLNLAKDCHFDNVVSVGSKSNINLNAGTCNLNSGIVASADASIKLNDKSVCNILKDSNLGKVDLTSTSAININGGKTVIAGTYNCGKQALTSVTNGQLWLKSDANINSALDINANSKVTLDKTCKLIGGVKADASAQIDINGDCHVLAPSDIKSICNVNSGSTLNLGGDSCIHSIHNLNADAKAIVNVNGGSTVKLEGVADINGKCNLIDGSNMHINGLTNIKSGIQATGSATSDIVIGKTGTCKILADSNINGNVIVNTGGKLDLNGKCNLGTSLQNSGVLTITKPCVINSVNSASNTVKSTSTFVQNNANAVCNMVAGGSIDAKTINFVSGTVKGVGALKCDTCNLGNRVDANLNIVGNVNLQPTATVVANVDSSINGATKFVPMVVASGSATVDGAVEVVCSADTWAKIDAGAAFKVVSAANVKGSLDVKASANASANVKANAWSVVGSPCNCEYVLKCNK